MRTCFFAILLPFYLFSCSLDELSLEEKVGQMLIAHFHGRIANEDARILTREAHIGGFIYYNWTNELESPQQVKELSVSLQNLAKFPLFISVDQEGGRVQRLKNGFTKIPSAYEVAQILTPEQAENLAYTVGTELAQVGINMNFAPVADVNVNPANPVIGNRSFGNETESVVTFGRSMVRGYQKAGIIPVLKHFPGHGDVTVDSHYALPVVDKPKEDLLRIELKPFQELSHEVDAIMTAHILMPAFDTLFSATVSQKILDELLRKEIGFQGIVISDSLVMKGVLSQFPSVDEAAIAAIQAGCDILVLGGRQLIGKDEKVELSPQDILRIHRSIIRAIQRGDIPIERINEAVSRIIRVKLNYVQRQECTESGRKGSSRRW